MRFEVRSAQAVTAFGGLAPCECDQLAQVAVAGARGRQQYQPGAGEGLPPFAFGQLEFGAVDQPERTRRLVVLADLFQGQMRAH